jgi:hypothetical protein
VPAGVIGVVLDELAIEDYALDLGGPDEAIRPISAISTPGLRTPYPRLENPIWRQPTRGHSHARSRGPQPAQGRANRSRFQLDRPLLRPAATLRSLISARRAQALPAEAGVRPADLAHCTDGATRPDTACQGAPGTLGP